MYDVVAAVTVAHPEVTPCTALLVQATVEPVRAVPPLDAGAIHETVATPFPETVATDVGVPGTTSGVADAVVEARDGLVIVGQVGAHLWHIGQEVGHNYIFGTVGHFANAAPRALVGKALAGAMRIGETDV